MKSWNEYLLEIEERAANATSAPWDNYWETGYEDSHPVMRYSGKAPACQLEECVIPGYKVKAHDAHFIAEARQDIPRLTQRVRKLEKSSRELCDSLHWIFIGGEFSHWLDQQSFPMAAAKELEEAMSANIALSEVLARGVEE